MLEKEKTYGPIKSEYQVFYITNYHISTRIEHLKCVNMGFSILPKDNSTCKLNH